MNNYYINHKICEYLNEIDNDEYKVTKDKFMIENAYILEYFEKAKIKPSSKKKSRKERM